MSDANAEPQFGGLFAEASSGNAPGNHPAPADAPAPAVAANASDWRAQFAPEYQDNPYLKTFNDPNALAKSYIEQHKLIGSRFENMTPEQLEHFHTAMNVPKEAGQYNFTLPEELSRDNLQEDWFKETAFKAKVTPKQAQELFSAYAEQVNSQTKAQREQAEATLREANQALDKEFGEAKPVKLKAAVQLLRNEMGDEFLKRFSQSDMANDPDTIKFLVKMAERSAEDRGVDLVGSQSWGPSKDQAVSEIARLQSDPEFTKKLSPSHPDYRASKAKWDKLFAMAYPD
jgi:hypothetical protein